MNGDLFAPPPTGKPVESAGNIAHVYKLSNGRVVSFDAKGQELTEYGGTWEEMKALICANLAPNAKVHE